MDERQALQILGFAATDTNVEQLKVLCRALAIFQRHTERIGEMWRTVGPDNSAHHMKHKADRIHHAEVNDGVEYEWAMDSALDLINYAAFYIRQKEEGLS